MKYNRFTVLKRLVKCVKIPVALIIAMQIIALITTAISLVSPYLYSLLIDKVMTNGQIELLSCIIPAMIGVFVIEIGLSALSTFVSVRYHNTVNLFIKQKLFSKLLKRDIGDIQNIDIGEQQGFVEQDSGAVSGFFSEQIGSFFMSFLYAAIYFVLMLLISPWLTLSSMIFIPLAILFGRYVGNKFNYYQNKLWQISAKNRSFLFDTIQKWREIKTQNLEERFAEEYDEKLQPERNLLLKWMFYLAMRNVFYAFKNSFVQNLLLYFIGGMLIIWDQITIGALLMFMSYMASFSGNVDAIIDSITGFISNKLVYDRLFAVLDMEETKKETINHDKFDIKLENLTFSYAANLPNVLTEISYEFKYGKKYLIVGKSGEGKSTLIKLILCMAHPDSGEIKIGKTELSMIDQQYLFQKITAVMQENQFFNLSIRENLRLIAPNATDEEIRSACEMACIADFIQALPSGYDTVIGERGIKLSGGQKQRLAIARLILHQPEVAILDEATSSLDAVTEARILENLNTLFHEKTLIVISHKPALQIDFDERIVVENNTLAVLN